MKARYSRRLLPLLVMTASFAGQSMGATNQYWNAGGTGGDGNWGTSPGDKNWNTLAGAPPVGNTFWADPSDEVAVFQDATGGTVTVIDTVQTAGIIQNGANYTINAGTITLVQDAALPQPFIEVQTGTLAIDTTLDGTHGLIKTGGGNLVLSNTNTYAGTTALTDGTLTLTGSLVSATVDIAPDATLVDSSSGLDAATVLTNAGKLTVNAADTVANYTQNGLGELAGSAALTVSGLATLNGGTVSGHLLGNTLSTGDVLVSSTGTLGGGSLSVTGSGNTLTLEGASSNVTVDIDAGATLVDSNGGLDAATTVTNSGKLTVNAADTVANYTQNGLGELAGTAALTVSGLATLNGGTVSGHLLGNTLSTGDVLVSSTGSLGGGSLSVTGSGKTLTLEGVSSNVTVDIAAGATLVDSSGGLDAATTVTNSGKLTVNAADTVANYISNGGMLANGPGTLTTTTAALNNGSSVAGLLNTNILTSHGAVTLSGTAAAETINIASGNLTNTGTLGGAFTHLDIAGGATLTASGTQHYTLLTTSGTAPGTWQGNLVNPTTMAVAPGGLGGIGTLQVNGNFTNSPGAILKLDIAAASHDLLGVAGTAGFGGALELNQVGALGSAPFVTINVVAAGSYTGDFTSLTENLDGEVWFNPRNGDVTRMAVPTGSGDKLFGSTANQTSTWVALYDDVIDPGVTNITRIPGGYHITGGIANGNNPDLLWALASSYTPTGLNSNLLNRLSPEVYVSFQDYAMQATRTHQRTALSAPALAATPKPAPKPDSKGGCKDATPVTAAGLQWEFFAATDYFNVATTNSQNQADYELSGIGIMAGARTMVTDRVQLAAYLAGDDGNIEGSLIDADGKGWSLGLLGEVLLEEKSRTHLTAGISYGKYTFDGTRGSASATSSGWTHGQVGFDDVASDALELYLGLEGVIYQNDRFRLIPSLGLRYATGSMDSFTENIRKTTGSPIALEVNQENYESALAEFALLAEVDLTRELSLWGQLGASAGIGQDPYSISGNFAKGSRTMRAEADGLSNDLWFIGLGANYKINESISVNLGYRAEFRSDADNQNSFNLSCSFRF